MKSYTVKNGNNTIEYSMTVDQGEILTEFFKHIYIGVSDNYENLTKQKLLDFIVKTYFRMYKGEED